MSEIDECQNIFNNLSDFMSATSNYINTGATFPTLTAVSNNLIYTDLVTFATSQTERAAGYSIGAAQEAISTAAGIGREMDMAVLVKSSIYSNMQSDFIDESNFYNQAGYYFTGVMSGNPTSGSQC
jgi:hypothetical protein